MNASAYWFSDYNQTLVFSVFSHFLFLALLMYIPKPNPLENIETIPLTVSLIPISTVVVQEKPSTPTIKEEVVPLPSEPAIKSKELIEEPDFNAVETKEILIKPIEVASLPPIKKSALKKNIQLSKQPNQDDTGRKILAQLNRLTGESKEKIVDDSNPLVKELNQLARLKPKLEPKSTSKNKVWEQTFKDLEKIQKTKPANDQREIFAPPIAEELENSLKELAALDEKIISQELENKSLPPETNEAFSEIKKLSNDEIDLQETPIESQNLKELESVEKIKIEKDVERKSVDVKEVENQEKSKPLEKLEFESFEKKPRVTGNKQKTYKDILNDLENLAALNPVLKLNSIKTPSTKEPINNLINRSVETGSALKSVKRSIEAEPIKNVVIEVSRVPFQAEEFKSKVQTSTSPFKVATAELSPNLTKNKLDSEKTSNEQTDDEFAQALNSYASIIKDKIYSHWEVPLGVPIRKKIVVSIMIFRMGTIEKPRLVQSSGEEKLDALAIKAIFDSEPFPPFPKEIKDPNIVININFKLEVQP